MAKKVLTALLALSMALSAFALPAAAETEHSPEMYSSGIASVGQIRQNSKFVYKINRNRDSVISVSVELAVLVRAEDFNRLSVCVNIEVFFFQRFTTERTDFSIIHSSFK